MQYYIYTAAGRVRVTFETEDGRKALEMPLDEARKFASDLTLAATTPTTLGGYLLRGWRARRRVPQSDVSG